MKERGMIFNGEMVRAILDGRKTQTRRIMKPQPADDIARGVFPNPNAFGWKSSLKHKYGSATAHFCPFGKPDDRIWVRETWARYNIDQNSHDIAYRATTPADWPEEGRWRPSIHMPRWASRILLEITGVRVERLHAADESDLLDELGDMLEDCDSVAGKAFNHAEHYAIAGVPVGLCPEMHGFKAWWDKVNGDGCFDSNPWVWVIEFKRVEVNCDE